MEGMPGQKIINSFFYELGFNSSLLNEFNKIYVLVSGGFDSTLLYEFCYANYPKTTYAVNCFNPYENSKTLDYFKSLDNFLQIKPSKKFDYKEILKEAFLTLPSAFEKYKERKYYKKLFGCCYYIKHKAFLKDKIFKENGSVVISGIKWGDGKQRRIFLSQLAKGSFKSLEIKKPTYFLRHKGGQLYCYPFRDFRKFDLPSNVIKVLKEKYPFIDHTGCALCPVLILNNIISEGDRYLNSVKFAEKLGLNELLIKIKQWNIEKGNVL